MKHFRTIAIVWGFVVVLVLPVLLILSNWKKYNLLSFQEYLICLLTFLVMFYMIREDNRADQRDAVK
jgi:hypothetical protein